MTELTRTKYTQHDDILNNDLREFDGMLEVACKQLSYKNLALTVRLWHKWQELLPRIQLGEEQ